jgi:hypothetical protein
MKKINLLIVLLMMLGCDTGTDGPNNDLKPTPELASLRDGVLDSLEIYVDLLKDSRSVYDFRDSLGGKRRDETPQVPWEEYFEAGSVLYTISLDSSRNTVDIVARREGFNSGEQLALRGLSGVYDPATKVLSLSLVDPRPYWGSHLFQTWHFDELQGGYEYEYEGLLDTSTTADIKVKLYYE